MTSPHRPRLIVALSLVAAAAVGCSGSNTVADKAGGTGNDQVTLTMANTASGPEDIPVIDAFIARVRELSGGKVTISLHNTWGDFAADDEQQVVKGVAAGDADLGWVASRAFDRLGVSSMQAWSAPMLIDSYPLLQAVVTSDGTTAMLRALDKIGVTPLGAAADSLRFPVGVKRPITAPADWRGIGFGTYQSEVQEATIKALGATPVRASGPMRDAAIESGQIQAFELDPKRYVVTGVFRTARYVVTNEVLWPNVAVVFANPGKLDSLTAQQRSWLDQAMADTTAKASDIAADTTASVATACRNGTHFVTASAHDVAAMRRAVEPVYAELEKDPATKAAIDAITALKKATPAAAAALKAPKRCMA